MGCESLIVSKYQDRKNASPVTQSDFDKGNEGSCILYTCSILYHALPGQILSYDTRLEENRRKRKEIEQTTGD